MRERLETVGFGVSRGGKKVEDPKTQRWCGLNLSLASSVLMWNGMSLWPWPGLELLNWPHRPQGVKVVWPVCGIHCTLLLGSALSPAGSLCCLGTCSLLPFLWPLTWRGEEARFPFWVLWLCVCHITSGRPLSWGKNTDQRSSS